MGFPVGYTYTEVYIPKLFIHLLSLLGFLRATIFSFFSILGLSHFLESEPHFHENQTHIPVDPPLSAVLIQELLPVIKFSDLQISCANAGEGHQPESSCAVCLYEFEDGEDIRCLLNCKHIFHKSCVDRWMDHDRKTCPLCRKHFVPRHLLEEYNQRLWAAIYNGPDFFNEDTVTPGF